MAWFKVDDGLVDHRKVRRLGRDKAPAMGVWVLCGAWAASNLTDGFVPAEVVQRYDAREKYAGRLVDVRLWAPAEHDGEDGYQFHDWSDIQPTRAEIEERRAEVRERVRKHRAKNGKFIPPDGDGGGGNANDDQNGNALHDELPTTAPSRPVPSRPGPSSSSGPADTGRRNRGTARAADLAATAHSPAAHRLVEHYAATCSRRPPAKILSQLAVEVDALLAEAWPDDEISHTLTAWGSKSLGPGALQAVAHEVVNRRPAAATASTADQRVAAAQALKSQLRALPGGA